MLSDAVNLLRRGQSLEAAQVMERLAMQEPRRAEVRRVYGVALTEVGDLAGAERELRSAIALDAKAPAAYADLGLAFAQMGRHDDADQAFRAGLEVDPNYVPALVRLSEMKLALGQPAQALAVTQTHAARLNAGLEVLTAHADALKALGRLEEAVVVLSRAVRVAPADAVAEHNLAAGLADSERFDEAALATDRAFAKGINAPETWQVRGRALQGLSRFDEAEAAMRKAVALRPTFADAQADLAQLIWMRSEDLAAASVGLDAAIAATPQFWPLHVKKAKLIENAGDRNGAYAILADISRREGMDPIVDVFASQIAVHLDPVAALVHAESAYRRMPGDPAVLSTLCQANLTADRPDQALKIAEALFARGPFDQYAIALFADACRALGDERCHPLYDLPALVHVSSIEAPKGWSGLAAFLSDLADRLSSRMALRAHPVGQSVRLGVQTQQSLNHVKDPVIAAFFQALDAPIRQYFAGLGQGLDPLRARLAANYKFNGAWSVRLRPHGHHANHIHPMGWISSAFYLQVPDAVQNGHQGWLKFGEPDAPGGPNLTAMHHVQPAPGRLVLFPSYMWHGTVPFSGEQHRLTAAFDLLPV